MNLTIINRSGQRIPRKFILGWVRKMVAHSRAELPKKLLKIVSDKQKEFVIVFLDPEDARRLNKEFRRKNYATDVLSFQSMDSSSFGELVICPAVISRQAREHGLLVREELGYMILHGYLHLLGYDHETSQKDAKRMFGIQDRLFEKLLRAN